MPGLMSAAPGWGTTHRRAHVRAALDQASSKAERTYDWAVRTVVANLAVLAAAFLTYLAVDGAGSDL